MCEQAFAGAKVGAEQGRIHIQRRHQREAFEIVALGKHLRADQDVGASGIGVGMRLREQALCRALAGGRVAVDAQHARGGEALGQA